MDRVSSGVPGLDPLLGGGFLPGSFTLVSGSSGTGKTILAFQFVYAGAKEGEPGVFISL
jgi:KaiC/GvpD/RAD55 family RecA-like ATPase